MTWLAFRVEIQTSDERDGTPARIQSELLRALEHRFGAVTVERDEVMFLDDVVGPSETIGTVTA